MMPHNSAKFGLGQGEPIRDRDKNWRIDSFRSFRRTWHHWTNHQKWKMKHSDFYGSNVVQWVVGSSVSADTLISRMISNDYSLISVHGMGISGRVYNEGETRVQSFCR